MADDMIMHEDEAATELYLISKGKVALVTEDQQRVFAIVRESEMFGDTDLFQGVPRLMAAQVTNELWRNFSDSWNRLS
jgi:CRP-like cAMP-binding protein